jgi:hypothetical protein
MLGGDLFGVRDGLLAARLPLDVAGDLIGLLTSRLNINPGSASCGSSGGMMQADLSRVARLRLLLDPRPLVVMSSSPSCRV